jgi:hypothetical protein
MSAQNTESDGGGVDRRAFLRRMGMIAFAVPIATTFSMSSIGDAFGLPTGPIQGCGANQTLVPGGFGGEVCVNNQGSSSNQSPRFGHQGFSGNQSSIPTQGFLANQPGFGTPNK